MPVNIRGMKSPLNTKTFVAILVKGNLRENIIMLTWKQWKNFFPVPDNATDFDPDTGKAKIVIGEYES